MRAGDLKALDRLVGRRATPRATADDLQVLLLQVVFALLMVFIIAYFLFVEKEKRDRVEEVMDLNRQKLTLALDKIAEEHRVRYGLNALMTQGTDGKRTFEPDAHVRDGRLEFAPAAKAAFSAGSASAYADYRDASALAADWRTATLAEAKLSESALEGDLKEWLSRVIETEVENVRLDARGVQRALAARLQRQWVEHPEALRDVQDAGALADELKSRSLRLVAAETGSPVLP